MKFHIAAIVVALTAVLGSTSASAKSQHSYGIKKPHAGYSAGMTTNDWVQNLWDVTHLGG